jgi:hypothetical protein
MPETSTYEGVHFVVLSDPSSRNYKEETVGISSFCSTPKVV